MNNVHMRYKLAVVLAGRGAAEELASRYNTSPRRLIQIAKCCDLRAAGRKKNGNQKLATSYRLQKAIEEFIMDEFKKNREILRHPAMDGYVYRGEEDGE